jgi:hypothetical protein
MIARQGVQTRQRDLLFTANPSLWWPKMATQVRDAGVELLLTVATVRCCIVVLYSMYSSSCKEMYTMADGRARRNWKGETKPMAQKRDKGTPENRGRRRGLITLAILSFASIILGVQLFLLKKENVVGARRLVDQPTQRLGHAQSTQSATNEMANDFGPKAKITSTTSTVEGPAASNSTFGEAKATYFPEVDQQHNVTLLQTNHSPNASMNFQWAFSSSWGSKEHIAAIIRDAEKANIKKPSTATVAYYYTKISRVVVAHTPRCDLLGSFVRPTIFLLAIARFYGWELEILPFKGSSGESALKHNLALGAAIDNRWGTGYQDVSNRRDYDPVDMNIHAYDILSFFPKVSPSATEHEWIQSERIPEDGVELHQLCQRHSSTNDTCYVQIPDDYHLVEQFVEAHGSLDDYFPYEFRTTLREEFLSHNMGRLQNLEYDMAAYNVVVHVRRGDINHPLRWIDQAVYYKIVRNICQSHEDAHVHIFSSGRNQDTNWSTLEGLAGTSTFHAFVSDRTMLANLLKVFVRR